MTLEELKSILEATGFPVAYSHFKSAVEPPFIVYLVDSEPNFKADNKVYKKLYDVRIELYTDKKDLVAESKLETLLNDNGLPSDADEVFIESENMYMRIYETRLI